MRVACVWWVEAAYAIFGLHAGKCLITITSAQNASERKTEGYSYEQEQR